MRAHGAWDGGKLVTLEIAGASHAMADIGMRMLTPRELFTAQGFPAGYVTAVVRESRGTDIQARAELMAAKTTERRADLQ